MTALCFQTRPREGEDYVGYVFAASRGKARALALLKSPEPFAPDRLFRIADELDP
jgi:hypothetical protein